MKDKIICLVGASGSGKTTLAKELEKEGYNIIHSYTNREPREPNEWGHTFITNWYPVIVSDVFVGIENGEDPDEIPCKYKYIDIDDMIAYFNSYNKGHHYFATKEQYQGKGTSIYVIDPGGAEEVRQNVKDAEVITIFLIADRLQRIDRLEKRLGYDFVLANNEEERYIHKREVIDRLEKDAKIFTKCKCDFVVDANRDIDLVVLDILEIIEQGE